MSSRGASRLFSTLRSNKNTSDNDSDDEAVDDTASFLIKDNVLQHLSHNKFTAQNIIEILRSLHNTLIRLKIGDHRHTDVLAEAKF